MAKLFYPPIAIGIAFYHFLKNFSRIYYLFALCQVKSNSPVPHVFTPKLTRTLKPKPTLGREKFEQPDDLPALRSARQEYTGRDSVDYSSLDYVIKEFTYSKDIFNKYQWPVVNITEKPIEEIASEIIGIKRRISAEEMTGKKDL
jgi:regulator of PEP synthase PpsR (kinase-PPPase family)